MSPLAFGLSVLWLTWFAVSCAAYILLVRRLEKCHHEEWKAMGRPAVFPRGTVEGGRSLQAFLVRRDFRKLGDPVLTRLGWLANVTVFVMVLVLVGSLGWIVVREFLL